MRKLLSFAFLAGIASLADAQPAAPPAPKENVPGCGMKYLTATAPPSPGIVYYWQGTQCDSSIAKRATSSYTVSYTCGNVAYYLRAKDSTGKWSNGCSSVTITNPVSVPCVSYPSSSTGTCGPNQTLTRSNPPSGTTFYWQGTKCDTLTNNSASTYATSATGTYYLRAKDSCSGKWATSCGSININPLPATPAVPAAASPACGLKTLSVASAPSGAGYYWQDTVSKGTSTSYYAASAYYVPDRCINTPVKYYVRARSSVGCWSDTSTSVTVTGSRADSLPCNPPNPTTTNYFCGDQTLNITQPLTGITYYWQGTACDTSMAKGSGTSYTVTATGTYYIRARFNCTGKWSSGCGSVSSVIQNPLPAGPPNPTINTPSCGLKTLSVAAAPSGVTYYWQGTSSGGQDTSKKGTSSYTVSDFCTQTPYTYYVRTRNNTSGCWSAASGSVVVNDPIANSNPCNPPKPTTTDNKCGAQTLSVPAPPGGITYFWQGEKCDSITTLPSSALYTVSKTGVYYIRARHDCKKLWSSGCDSVSAVFHNPLPAEPPVPSVDSCARLLRMPSAPSGVKYLWQGTACGTQTNLPATSPYTVTTLGTNATVFVNAQSDSGCFSAKCTPVTFNISTIPCPGPKTPPNPTAVTSKCTAILTRAVPPSAGVVYYWQDTVCGTDTLNSSLNYTAAANATYYLRARDSISQWSSGCGSVKVTITNIPAAPPVPTVSNNLCDAKTLSRTAPPAGVSYFWQGTSCGTDTGNSAATYNASASGTYYLKAKNDTGCWSWCSSVSVNIVSTPVVNAGADTSICSGTSAQLNVSSNISGVSYLWTSSAGLSDSSIANPVASPASTTTFTVKIDNKGCSDTDSVVVTVVPVPVADAGKDTAVCNGNTVQLNVSGGISGSAYNWTPSAGLSNATLSNPVASASVTTTYRVVITNSGICSDTDSVAVTINPLPVVVAKSNAASINCGDSTTLSATGAITYLWKPSAGLNDTAIAGPRAKPVITTDYVAIGTDNNGCSGKDTVTVTVIPPTIKATASRTSISSGDTVTLFAAGGKTYLWTPSAELDDSTKAAPVAKPKKTVSFILIGTVSTGCTGKDTVEITVNDEDKCKSFVPNAFSPNGNKVNDTLRVRVPVECVKEIHFAIYDRWGQKVFETNDIAKGWDGTIDGNAANSGVYFYFGKIVRENGEEEKISGNISLLK